MYVIGSDVKLTVNQGLNIVEGRRVIASFFGCVSELEASYAVFHQAGGFDWRTSIRVTTGESMTTGGSAKKTPRLP